MATDRLALYNIALLSLGERRIASLTEDRESRRELDEVYTRGAGAVEFFLEQGLWNFAIRTLKIDKSSSVTPEFGLANAFDLPSDYIRLVQISAGEFFSEPLVQFEIETAFIFADVDPIYLRFVSDDGDFGNDLSLWPETFTLWAGNWLGDQIAPLVIPDLAAVAEHKRETKRLLVDARSKDAMQEPPRFPPMGSWARSRLGGGGRRDRGSRSQLIG